MNMGILGDYGSRIIISSIGGIRRTIARRNVYITIGGISDVLNFFGVVGVFEIFIVSINKYWDFLSLLRYHHCQ